MASLFATVWALVAYPFRVARETLSNLTDVLAQATPEDLIPPWIWGATDEYVGVGQDPVPTCARLPGDTLRANDGQRRARGHAGHRLDRLSDVGRADLHLPVPVRRRPSDPAGRPGVAAHRLSG